MSRFELSSEDGVIRHYPSKEAALVAAIPGDSLLDREARPGGIELWLVGGDLERKTLGAIRRKSQDVPQKDERAEWLKRRREGIGGSDAPVVLGLSPWKSPLALWSEKVGLIEEDDLSNREYIEWGEILEQPIAEKYIRETKRELIDHGRHFIFQSNTHPHMISTIDRKIIASLVDDKPGAGILSIKTAAAFKTGEWEEEPPLQYQVQLQHELCVTNLEWGSFAVLIGGQRFRWCDVVKNDRFCSYLVEKEEEFWHQVRTGNPPAADASDSTREVLRKLYPADTGESIALPPEAIAWDEQLQFAKAEIKSAMDRKQEAENKFKAAIGKATIGILADGVTYSWKASSRAGYTVAPTITRTLRRIKG